MSFNHKRKTRSQQPQFFLKGRERESTLNLGLGIKLQQISGGQVMRNPFILDISNHDVMDETVSQFVSLTISTPIGLQTSSECLYSLNFKKDKKKKKSVLISVYMSEITHPIHMQAYLLEELQGYVLPHKICSYLA